MNIKLKGTVPECDSIKVTCNQDSKRIDTIDNCAEFVIKDNENVEIVMEQEEAKSDLSLWTILIFILTFPLQGIFNILLMNIDNKWYHCVRAYNIRACFEICGDKDINIQFDLSGTRYDALNHTWIYPKLILSPQFHVNVDYEKNEQGIRNGYYSYVRKLLSAYLVLLLIVISLLVIAVSNSITMAIAISAILAVLFTVIIVLLIIHEYKRLVVLLKELG